MLFGAYNPQPLAQLATYSPDPLGVADSQPALLAASNAGNPFVIGTGTYLVNSNVTIAPNVQFEPGAVLKPANGVTIVLQSSLQAGVFQVFDLTLGGLITLPRSCGEVWAEWWGAKGDNAKTNNEVSFNQAWFALLNASASGFGFGGFINIDRGIFLKSGSSYHSDGISFRGHGLFNTLIKANAGTWSGTNMFLSQSAVPVIFTAAPNAAATSATLTVGYSGSTDAAVTIVFFAVNGSACEVHTGSVTGGGTAVSWTGGLANNSTVNAAVLTKQAIFQNNIIDLRVDASDLAAITQVIYAPAWQQKSGLHGCYITNYRNYGVFLEFGYGGAAQLTFRRTEFFSSQNAIAGSAAIKIGGTNGLGGSIGRFKFTLDEIQMGGLPATVTWANSIAPALTFTGAPGATATSATLNATWTGTTAAYLVWFVETSGGANELRAVTLTNGQTTATWTGGLANACNATTSAAPSTSLSGALAANWPYPTGVWNVQFSDGESRNVTFTNGATTATWTTNITSATGVTAAASAASPNSQGVVCSNSRVELNCQDVHIEGAFNGFDIDGACDLVGGPIAADGSPTVTNLITCETTWTGAIVLSGARQCAAAKLINDKGRATLNPVDVPSNIIIWPPGPIPGTTTALGVGTLVYDPVGGGLTINTASGSSPFTLNGAAGFNTYLTIDGVGSNSAALLWEIAGSAYGRWGVDSAGNLMTGSTLGDSFIRVANKSFLVSTNDGTGIQFHLTATGDIVQTRGVAVCLRATAIEQRTSTTTLTNSTQLTYAIPAAGTYEFELLVFSYFTTAATDGFTANVNYSGTFTAVGSYLCGSLTNGTATDLGIQPVEISATVNNALAGLTLATYGASVTSAAPAVHKIKGNLIATGTGTLAFAFAQSTTGVDSSNLGVGSYMTVTQLS